MEGHCQCGQIKFTTPTPKPHEIYFCHCTECRHQSSSTYGVTAVFPHFKLQEPFPGAIKVYERRGPRGLTNCYFCAKCGSRLIGEPIEEDGKPAKMMSVKAGCLDGLTKEDYRKAAHIYTKNAVVDIPEGVEAYESDPDS